jgi:hypothetical protein
MQPIVPDMILKFMNRRIPMPAVSKKQRQAMAIAEHHPSKLHVKNKGMLNMSKSKLHEFSKTPEKHLPARKRFVSSPSTIKRRNY